MTKFTVFPILLFLFISAIQPIQAQTSASGLDQWQALIARQIKYPIEAIRARKEGVVSIALVTDEKGNLADIKFEKTASPFFDDQVLKSVESLRDLWTPEMLEGRKAGEVYFMVFNFMLLQEGESREIRIKTAVSMIEKGKSEKALKIAESLVNANPYDIQGLQLRSQINRQLGNEEAATADLLTYQKIEVQVLKQIDIRVFQQVSTQSLSGTIRN